MRSLPFVLAASDHGPLIVSRLDFAQNPSGFYGVGYQILHTGSYDASEIELVTGILDDCRCRAGDGVVALDAGANIGVHTVSMARHMIDWGAVLAVEAQERLFYALCGNIALSNLFNARAVFAALGASEGTLGVPQPDYRRAGSLGSLELRHTPRTEFIGQPIDYGAEALIEIPQVSIDSMRLARLDFLKIDVEGMELEVLEGASETLERFRPAILAEWIKCGAARIRETLAPLGYSFREIGMNVLATPGDA